MCLNCNNDDNKNNSYNKNTNNLLCSMLKTAKYDMFNYDQRLLTFSRS